MNKLRWWLVSGAGIPGPCASASGSPALTPLANELVADRPTSLSPDSWVFQSRPCMFFRRLKAKTSQIFAEDVV
jgi:hypothetical protein